MTLAIGVSIAGMTPAQAQTPTSVQGACAKALGAPYNAQKGGWYLPPGSPKEPQWHACVAAGGPGKARK